ncbi:sulfatase [Myxococcota bacterium]|nr:sulfatase [Myxococcota bacterium]
MGHWGLVLLLSICMSQPACDAALPAPNSRPNILLIVVDTLRADHVGIYGHSRPTTPAIDALAEKGSFFPQAFAQSSWTLPSMTTLLTGLFPHQHRVGRDPTESRLFGRLAPEIPTLAERLGEVGYARGAIVNNTFLAPEFGLARGFETYDYQGATKWKVRSAEKSVESALQWVDDQSSPWFLVVHFMEPHLFYDPPESVRGAFTGAEAPPVEVPFGTDSVVTQIRRTGLTAEERDYVERLYDEEILYVDRAIGRLVDTLENEPAGKNLVVIVTADHGEEFFDHGGFEHGHTLYGELIRVPLVISGPGLARGEVRGVVQHVDLSRGILGFAGASQQGLPDGVDLFALLRDGAALESSREALSENVLYGPPRASLSRANRRLHRRLDRPSGEVWALDANGLEIAPVDPAERPDLFRRLSEGLKKRRGHVRTWAPEAGLRLENDEMLSQLKALGYLEDESR